METYDPLVAPDPAAWLALDEGERMMLVEAYHDESGLDADRLQTHVGVHVVVENQIAEGDALPVREKARQLMAQGLDRHDAIHAIGSVLMTTIFKMQQRGETDIEPTGAYFSALRRLNARKWLRSG